MTAVARILACGALDRGDDAAGLLAVRELQAAIGWVAEVDEVGQLSAEHLVGDPPDCTRIVVDCVRGIDPGAILDLPLSELPRVEAIGSVTSTHALPIGRAVALAQAVGAVNPQDRFVGIGGAAFDAGGRLSPAVAGGLPELRRHLRVRLQAARHRDRASVSRRPR